MREGRKGGLREEPFEAKLALRRINPWMLALATGCLLLYLGSWIEQVFELKSWKELGTTFGTTYKGGALLLALYMLRSYPVIFLKKTAKVEQPVRIDPEFVRIGSVAIPRATVGNAHLVPTSQGNVFVRISRRRRVPIDLEVRDREEGRRVLRALGFDASQTVAKFRGASRLMEYRVFSAWLGFGLPLLFMGMMMMMLAHPEWWCLAVGFLVFVAMTVMSAPSSHIEIGADGVLLTWLGATRFLSLAKMRSVEQTTIGRWTGARVTMEGGNVAWLPVGSAWSESAVERTAALVDRIRTALETHANGSIDAAAALLARRERGVRDWIQELRAIGAGANADLRTAPVNEETLWRIVESHGVEPVERAAAAIALGGSLDEGGKRRLRVAVETVVDERLRSAIEAAALGEDEALEEALGEVSKAKAS